MCSCSRKGRPLKVRVMSKTPSPYLQLRSRNEISTWFSGRNSPLNQAMRQLVGCVMGVPTILSVHIRVPSSGRRLELSSSADRRFLRQLPELRQLPVGVLFAAQLLIGPRQQIVRFAIAWIELHGALQPP